MNSSPNTTTVAYLGPRGTFTESAVVAFEETGVFAQIPGVQVTTDYNLLACSSPLDVLNAVRTGEATFGVAAIENSVDGPVTPTFDALAAGDGVYIYAELDLPIAFAVMVRPGTQLSQAQTITTHPVAYQQVKNWVKKNLGDLQFVAASSNGAAAAAVAEGKADIAVAPARAAEMYNLTVVADGIADVPGARTRFVLVGPAHKPRQRARENRTAVVFTLKNAPGSLVGALTEFSVRGVDLSRIESRPTEDGLGTYRFHVDINGHIDDLPVAEALRALYLRCENIQFLGSWPAVPGNGYTAWEGDLALEKISEAQEWLKEIQDGITG